VYVTVFSILCSLSSFFVLSYLFGCYHFLMNKDIYITTPATFFESELIIRAYQKGVITMKDTIFKYK